MNEEQHIHVDAYFYNCGSITSVKVPVVTEHSIKIILNDVHYSIMACTPNDIEYFTIGHLFNEGIISGKDDIVDIKINEQKNICDVKIKTSLPDGFNYFKSNSAGVLGKRLHVPVNISRNPVKVKASIITEKMKIFLNKSHLHEITHGVHSAGLYDNLGNETIFIDDIGRHNAIDKITGFALKNNINFEDKMIFLTGRLASEIVNKILHSPVPILVSRAFPTNISCRLAKENNLTMIGKAEKESFYIFNGVENILI